MTLEEELERDLRATYTVARDHGYIAHYFIQMLDEYGGLATAKRLLIESTPQEGLFKLYDLQMLHISLEAVVLKEKYSQLFTPTELAEAHRRLEDLKYKF